MRDCALNSSMVIGDRAEGRSLCKLLNTRRCTPYFPLCLVLGIFLFVVNAGMGQQRALDAVSCRGIVVSTGEERKSEAGSHFCAWRLHLDVSMHVMV